MSKHELDKIEAMSKRIGTVVGDAEEMLAKTKKERLDEIEAKGKKSGTERREVNYTRKVIPFQNYEIVVELTSDGKFIQIEEVRIKKDFRDSSQRTRQKAFKYIDSYQPE